MDSATIINRFHQLQSQRKTLDTLLNDIDQLVVPYRGEFFNDLLSEHQVEWHRTQIYDSTAVVSCTRLASAIHSNLTSPVTRWFGLRFRDEDLNTDQAAKEWLEDCEERVWQALVESDFDNNAAEMYKDICSFGTALLMEEQKDDLEWKGIDFTALPVMDSYFEMGPDGVPYTLYRQLKYTRLELETRFPDMPEHIKLEDDHAEKSSVDTKIRVVFCVYYRDKDAVGESDDPIEPLLRPVGYKYVLEHSKIKLEEGGYYHFPGMVIRWAKTAGAKWGNSPAMELLSDIKQLNELVSQTSEARAKAIDPPMLVEDRALFGDLDLEAGGVTVVTNLDGIRELESKSRFDQAIEERQRLQESVRMGFFIDQLTFKDSPAMTATEVLERKQLMMQFMAPTLGRLQTDFLSPLIQITFGILMRQGQLKEIPDSAAGADMDIEYVGPMPRAQKAEVAVGIESWLMGMANLGELFPEMMDVVDVDQAARTLAELRGVPAKILKPENEVKEVREARAEQQRQAQETENIRLGGEAAEQAGKGAKAIGEAGLEAVQ